LYAGYYIAELLSDLTDHGDPHPELFAAADAALLALDGAGDVAAVIARFEMVLLKYLGHLPELDACVECGAAIGETGRVSFGQLAGGVLCTRCKSGKRQVASVRIETIQILRDLVQDNGPWEATTIDRTRWGELRGIVSHYLANLLGKRPRMASYLGMIAG
jgi:DNA repair protein RecO (recombination protein O)